MKPTAIKGYERVVGFDVKENARDDESDSKLASKISQPSSSGQNPQLSGLAVKKKPFELGSSSGPLAFTPFSARPRDYGVFRHTTDEKNLAPISDEGIIAGKTQGMGEPTMDGSIGSVYTDRVFVFKGQGHGTVDARPGSVAVVSTETPVKDTNYEHPDAVAAYFSTEKIPPLRDIGSHGDEQKTFSFVTPMSPRTRQGAARFLQRLGHQDVDEAKAEQNVLEKLQSTFPMTYRTPRK